ncbi:MAG: hypothetical protein GWP91_05330 [Rhodobacterales bacterium]|nr:hypothetical protein [Rhodobacterales bacterium]
MNPIAAGLGGALFLGVLQGLTEFLPVSSSGHLVLFQQFVDVGDDEVLFDLILHLGTLVPVLYFYREHVVALVRDPIVGTGPMMKRQGVKDLSLLVAASIPTAIIGLTFEDTFDALFKNPAALTITFAITGVLLFLSGRFDRSSINRELTLPLAFALGIAQGMAITPGISRSGTTIAIALMIGLNRDKAARFSFLMSVPAIGGAVLLKGLKADLSSLDPMALGVGGLSSMITGYIALTLLVKAVQGGTFPRFAWYCWSAAIVAGVLAFNA